ncbi:proto-oncogene serine/threonine-protein kinase mos [Haematobia irritans]|uniref:proto-oncogene serine/threonine-protein kinase mos n=1 Tax=Haematobia irritans TaxID=7368 RepID=UPI003F50751B
MSFLLFPTKENELILNTPKRQELMKDGPPLSQVKHNLLGRGSYGTVIKAIYKAKPVAVKIIKNVKDVNNQIMMNESHILHWKHPNIVRILKIESTSNFGIVIMERFNGECLQNILDTMNIEIINRIIIAMDIVSGLMYCHTKRILHMDVKPQNIMISFAKPQVYSSKPATRQRLYICKLCDFGSSLKLTNKQENMRGQVKGTLRYMAPEALKEEYLTPAVDIYSLGITLWQMKYRILPYHWLNGNEIVAYQVVKNQLRPNKAPAEKYPANNKLSTHDQDQCLCDTNSNPISSQTLEDLLRVLQQTNCELPNLPKSNGMAPIKRIPFKELNNNNQNFKQLKVKRDLRNEFAPMEKYGFSAILNDSREINMERRILLETLYDDIYQSCWHDNSNLRPTSSELYKYFKDML